MQLIAFATTWVYARTRTERGQDLLEYALLGGLIAAAIVAVAGATLLSGTDGWLTNMVNNLGRCIDFDKTTNCGPL